MLDAHVIENPSSGNGILVPPDHSRGSHDRELEVASDLARLSTLLDSMEKIAALRHAELQNANAAQTASIKTAVDKVDEWIGWAEQFEASVMQDLREIHKQLDTHNVRDLEGFTAVERKFAVTDEAHNQRFGQVANDLAAVTLQIKELRESVRGTVRVVWFRDTWRVIIAVLGLVVTSATILNFTHALLHWP